MTRVVVIGHGPAAHRFVERLHHHGHRGPVTVIGAERHLAYNRPLLASVLVRTLSAEAVTLPSLPPGTRVHVGVRATRIDRDRRLVHCDDGVVHRYDVLVMATGARPRTPWLPGLLGPDGHLAAGARALRTLADCERTAEGRVVVLGGGALGVEAALALRGGGSVVTLVHPKPHPMDKQLDPVAGRVLAAHLEGAGVDLRLGHRAVRYSPGRLTLASGVGLSPDTLLLCTGAAPDVELARKTGLAVRSGVLVDDRLRTDDPYIHAIGDCAEHEGTAAGLIAPAWDQAETLAQLLAGRRVRYRGTRRIVRLKASGLDVASLGSLEDLTDPHAKVEAVTLSDAARGRYAKLALYDQRITGAVVVGFPEAIASVSQLYDRDLPVPSDWLGLLMGTPTAERATHVELPENAVICHCNNVTKGALLRAWRDGAREMPDMAEATRATTGCGGCTDDVRRIRDAARSARTAKTAETAGRSSGP
ncbi:FAD-dependent oxidoreductase [Streptomyces sp. NPDC004647]|uniref:FAD-dependent oxidoreductase n=1 Tax=Streptomyces sp. NPDC004647 TaxID=3154671 RepID=UPI0033ADA46F